jgi:hypothetical protein
MDRRAAFFALAAVVCAALIPAAEPDVRWVPALTAAVYVVLALASFLDFRSRRRGDP